MTISIRGYTRHQGGKLVTVHGYDTNARDAAIPGVPDGASVRSQVEHVRRQAMGIAPPGTYPLPDPNLASTAGITSYQLFPGGKIPAQPIVRWRRSVLPIHGAYKIPKK